jgi:hypothetical protein
VNARKVAIFGLVTSVIGFFFERRGVSGVSPGGTAWNVKFHEGEWAVYVDYEIPGGTGARLLATEPFSTREKAVAAAETIP